MMIRSVTAASHSYKRTRQPDEVGQEPTVLAKYDSSAIQSSTMQAMLQLMRSKGFLSLEHRSSDKLRNVFGTSCEELNDSRIQNLLLDVDSYGRKSAELHASAMLPDVFGPLSDTDIKQYFNGKRLRGNWTKQRQIPTVGRVMAMQGGNNLTSAAKPGKDPKKILSDRQLVLSKILTNLTLAEHAAVNSNDFEGAEHIRKRWRVLRASRHVISPFADAYRSSDSGVRHAMKSKILTALKLEPERDAGDGPLSEAPSEIAGSGGVLFYYDYEMPRYATVMVDIMNHVWTRGTDGRRGNSLFQVTVLKLKHLLRPWFTGRRSTQLKQLQLHIDDPSNVIPQKRGEQARRDSTRDAGNGRMVAVDEELYSMGFHSAISVPWTTLISSRRSRDAICSLHLFCGAVAALELPEENNRNVEVYLYGGVFLLRDNLCRFGFGQTHS